MRVAMLLLILLVGACADGTPEIAFDLDECRYCRMIISDERFAAAATTATGRTVRFDSIECLAGWVLAEEEPPRSVWVTDAARPGVLVPASEARFRRDSTLHSPMGQGWVAGDDKAGGIPWDSVLAEVRLAGALPAAHSHGD